MATRAWPDARGNVNDTATLDGKERPVLIIRASSRLRLPDLDEIWHHRELLYFLVWREVKIRYKQTLLGVAWALIQPAAIVLVFTLLFSRFTHAGTETSDYALVAAAGVIPWNFFAQGVNQASNSLWTSASLVTKVYFPRVLIPLATILAALVDSTIGLAILAPLMVYYRRPISPSLVWLPVVMAVATVTVLSAAIWLSALTAKYRDLRFVIPFALQLGLFVTPVIYPASVVVASFEARGLPGWVVGLNPMTGVIEALRWSVLGLEPFPVGLVSIGLAVTAFALLCGALYFRSVERSLADFV